MPLLSVVVPCYNIELYVTACLESLRQQTNSDFEVIVVDDGSTDTTPDRIAAFCATDDRFQNVRKENGGLGAARNTGTGVATGEYLTFVDGDDVLHPQAHQRMLASLGSTGSDFAICSAGRFNRLGTSSSYTHVRAITGSRSRTHISRQPELVLDRMAWNKVYRREFWDRENLEFPLSPMGEDFPVSVEAHVKSDVVDVLNEALYFWRERDGGEASQTQRSSDLLRLHGRFETSMAAWDLAAAGAPEAIPLLREYLLDIDVTAILAALIVTPTDHQSEVLRLAREMSDRLGGADDPARAPFHRLQAALLASGDVDGLVELHRFRERFGSHAPLDRVGLLHPRLVERLPGVRGGSAPPEVYSPEAGRRTITARVVDADWVGELLEVRIQVEVPLNRAPRARFKVWLESAEGTVEEFPVIACVVERVAPAPTSPQLVELRATLDPALLEKSPKRGRGLWNFRLQLDGRDADPPCALDGISSGRERFVSPRADGNRGNLIIRPYMSATGFAITVRRQIAVLTGCEAVGDVLEVAGELRYVDEVGEVRLGLTDRRGDELAFPVELSRADDVWAFRSRIPAALLADHPGYASPLATRQTFEPWLDSGSFRYALTPGPDVTSTSVVVGHRMITLTRSMAGTVHVLESRTAPEVTAITWTDATTLRLDGVWRGPGALPAEVVVDHFGDPGGPVERREVLKADGGHYTVEVDVAELVRLHTERLDPDAELPPRIWHLLLGVDELELAQVFDRSAVASFPAPRYVDGVRVAVVLARDDLVRLAVGG